MQIREMQAADWPQVAAIYQQGINCKYATFVREVPSYQIWDAWHLEQCRLVAVVNGQVLGWVALSPTNNHGAYRGVAEISIYVAAAARGQKIGSALIEAVIAASEDAGIWTLQATVFEINQASRALHQKAGFRLVGLRQNIDRDQDGIWRNTLLFERRSPLFI